MESPKQSQSDSVEFWRKQAKHYEQKVNDIQQELDEYTENSAQLEKELEASLLQVEKQNKDLTHQNQRLKNEIDMLRNKLERSQHETTALESELKALKVEKDTQCLYVRELEQKNDDLERGQRVISESVSYIEALLNQAYERNAVLESEVDEKENLKIELQRISDEARDLKQELKVKERHPVTKKEEDSNENISLNGHVINSTCSQVETETQTITLTPQKREVNGNAMTPSSRVSAINIVGDLLRKVGLERFLCRECGKVKCACELPTAVTRQSMPSGDPEASCFGYNGNTERECYSEQFSNSNSLDYKNNGVLQRNHSDPYCDVQSNNSLESRATQRNSEQPFKRTGENGKLRKSFAVRSREGIENLLGFTSALESKLATCRSSVRPKEHSPNTTADVSKDYRCVLKN